LQRGADRGGGATAGYLLAADRAGGDAAELDDRLDVHRDLGKAGLGLKAPKRPGAARKDTRRLVRDQLHGLCECHRAIRGDFDSRAEGGATGWSYVEVLPYFRESEGLAPNNEISVDGPARKTTGPLVRDPILPAARQFVEAAVAAGIPRATITDATTTPRGWCHSAKRRRGTASDRALIGRFLLASGAAVEPDPHHRGARSA